ncbi:MAG: prephenate dehydrogenase [Anaerolineae bacterium]
MSKPRITIVGLGLVGSSIGLALKEQGGNYEIVGHDREPSVSGKARKMGAVDGTEWNLIAACEGAELILLALPIASIQSTLAAIAQDLKPGCIVTDTATLKRPVLAWAAEFLPDSVSFVGGNPILAPAAAQAARRGVDAASASLLHGAQYCLTPAPTADAAAVQVVSDMVTSLGAQPYFLDAAEHDGLMAWTSHLPAALGVALMQTACGASSWSEMRRLAGDTFAGATGILEDDAASLSSLLLENAENLFRLLDIFQERMDALRQMVETGDREALQKLLEGLAETRLRWTADRERGRWEEGPRTEMPTKGDLFGSLFGFGGSWAARRKKKQEDKEKRDELMR